MSIEDDTLAIARDDVPIAQSAFHPVVTGGTSKSVIHSPFAPENSQLVDNAIGLAQHLPTGADVAVSVSLNRSRFNPAFATLDSTYASDRTLTVRQPILKGFGTTINNLAVRRAEISADFAMRNYRSRALDLIESTERAYFAVGGAREQLTVFEKSLQLAQKLQIDARGREEAGMSTHLDVLQAEVGVANARRNLLEAQSVVKDSEDALVALIGRFELDTTLGATTLEGTTDAASLSSSHSDVAMAYERAKSANPDLQSARAQLDLAQLEFVSARDNLRPSLDLDLGLGSGGYDDAAGRAFVEGFKRAESSWQVGLSVSIPIGWVAERARYRQARAAINRQQLVIGALEQQILVNVRSAVRNVETQTESEKLAAQAAELSERQYERETQRFDAGLTTSRRVLEAQTDLETARVTHVQSRLSLQTALATLRRLEASAPERYAIDIAGLGRGAEGQ